MISSVNMFAFWIVIILIQLGRCATGYTSGCDTCARNGGCKTVHGSLRVTVMSRGYNPVVTVPAGACSINVSERVPSSNFLAVKEAGGRYILNGRWSVNTPGRYPGSGTTFLYSRQTPGCPGECLIADGPTDRRTVIQILYHARNPGISFSYQVPKQQQTRDPSTAWKDTAADDANSIYRHSDNSKAELRETQPGYMSVDGWTSEHTNSKTETTTSTPFPVFAPVPGISAVHNRRPIFSSEFRYGDRKERVNARSGTNHDVKSDESSSRKHRQELREVTYSRSVDDNTVQGGSENRFTSADPLNSNLIYTDEAVEPEEGSGSNIVSILAKHAWSLSGHTNCTRTCGGGIQETIYTCVHTGTLDNVPEDNCDGAIKPEVQHVVCNAEACTPKWKTGQWLQCSSTCGKGQQSRDVSCHQRVSATVSLHLSDEYCTSSRPASERQCFQQPCYSWIAGTWRECSSTCGIGTMQRRVECQEESGTVVNGNLCNQSKPLTEESCDMGSCTRHWYHSSWTDQCSADCGTGVVTRHVHCATELGHVLSSDQCAASDRPVSEKSCRQEVGCGGSWFTGPWSKCSRSCGDGVKQRFVVCMKQVGNRLMITSDEHCVDDKPEVRDTCSRADCGHLWHMTEWSECSVTCEGGTKQRSVRCIGDDMEPSDLCDPSEKPSTSRSCNRERCWTRPKQTSQVAGCRDKYPNCHVVVQAHLCRYPYYQRKCCLTCSNAISREYRNIRRRSVPTNL